MFAIEEIETSQSGEVIRIRVNLHPRTLPREITIEVSHRNQATAGSHCRMCHVAAPLHLPACPELGLALDAMEG